MMFRRDVVIMKSKNVMRLASSLTFGALLLRSVLMAALSLTPTTSTYRYFAYGSNMLRPVLSVLRHVEPLSATAAVLPDYKLRFDIGGGGFLDGAAASVEASCGDMVHGVLYNLTPIDFAKVGNTEGVPLVYRWELCRVCPYVGDGDSAGLREANKSSNSTLAYTLVKTFPGMSRCAYPSRSYKDILIQGAEQWKLDKSYLDMLKATTVARNLIVPDGLAGILLKFAEFRR